MQILEDALVICKFGRFHIRLLFASLASVFASTMVTTTSSYILPNAECDLDMDIMQKGLLNTGPFFGQIGATLFSGFLVDAFGRRIFLVGGHASIFILSVLEGSSQNFWTLFFIKVLEGIALSLCFGTVATMVSEFTHKGVRDRVLMFQCSFMPMSLIGVALIAWGLLPQQHWHVVIWRDYFEIHVWNIFIYVCSVFSLIATILYYTIPESPKYLLSHGQEFESMEVLKSIYNENTGKDKDMFPIKSLTTSGTYNPTKKIGIRKQITNALFEVKELFRRPLIFQLLLFSVLTFVCLFGYTALRLWYPQLSTIIENYKKDYGESARFCTMVDYYTKDLKINGTGVNNISISDDCVPQLSGSETYINCIILGLVSFFFISVSGYLVDYLGQKLLMFILFILCALCSGCIYWTSSSLQIALLISTTCAFMQAALSLQQNVLIRVFPTTLRALAMSIIVMLGRIGSLVGGILFPIMLEINCMAPFLALTVITLCVAVLVYFMPNPSKENKGTGDK
ncbi:synaptic vesicle glycoprotein 2C-like [Epargyreus clarus]|uniref:synaptic vesicle glycoprotein 2C-like n=1 Tax=Epargyreus clarus TaxID=520877 RepID=UPI003C300E26